MTAKRIAGVSLTFSWTSLIGALDGVLRALGAARPFHELMGVTGFAFRLALTEEAGVLAAAPAAAAVGLRSALPLLENAGVGLELMEARPDEPAYGDRRHEALRAMRRSIDRGRPAIAYDLHVPEFGIVGGYDDAAGTLTVSTLMSGQFGATLAERRWPVPERRGPMIVLVPGRLRPVDPGGAAVTALRFAVAYAEAGDPDDSTGATHGLAAYARWRECFERGEPIDPAGNARAIQTVQAARRDAARFLRESGFGAPAAGALAKAAEAYERVALAVSRMATLFPYPAGGDPTSPAGRHVALAALRDAEAHEREALEQVRAALASLPEEGADSRMRGALLLFRRIFGRRAASDE